MISSLLGMGSLDGFMNAGRSLSRSDLGRTAVAALPALANTASAFAPSGAWMYFKVAAGLLSAGGLWVLKRYNSGTAQTIGVVEELNLELVPLRRGVGELGSTVRENAGLVGSLRAIEFQLQPAGVGAAVNDAPMTDGEISALFDRLLQFLQTEAERPTLEIDFLRLRMEIAQLRRRVDELKREQVLDNARISELDADLRSVAEERERVHRERQDLLTQLVNGGR